MLGFLIVSLLVNVLLGIMFYMASAELKESNETIANLQKIIKAEQEHAAENYQQFRKAVTAAATLQDDLVKVSKKYQELKDEVKKRAAQSKKKAVKKSK